MLPNGLCHLLGLLFGLGFNWYVTREERAGRRGFVALWVVVGVSVTLLLSVPTVSRVIDQQSACVAGKRMLGASVISWLIIREILIEFAATGLPMTAGSLWRYWQALTRF